MTKFWNKADDTGDIYIFGDIVSERWDDSEVTAKSFLDDLKGFDGRDITVHINSGGGDVFAALAIYNVLKNHKGKVTVAVDGLAASAASLIACAGEHVTMAANALMMIHNPSVGLVGYFGETDLNKVQSSLKAVKSSILTTYQTKTSLSEDSLGKMIDAETWINAQTALALGFADEIAGSAEIEVDDANKILFVNSLKVDTSKFDNSKLQAALRCVDGQMDRWVVKKKNTTHLPISQSTHLNETEEKIMDDKSFIAKLKKILGNESAGDTEKPDVKDEAEKVRSEELARIRDLTALKNGSKAVDAIVDIAITDGSKVADVQKYVDAVKNIPTENAADKKLAAIVALIEDNLKSGAEGVQGSTGDDKPDEREETAKMIAKYAV